MTSARQTAEDLESFIVKSRFINCLNRLRILYRTAPNPSTGAGRPSRSGCGVSALAFGQESFMNSGRWRSFVVQQNLNESAAAVRKDNSRRSDNALALAVAGQHDVHLNQARW